MWRRPAPAWRRWASRVTAPGADAAVNPLSVSQGAKLVRRVFGLALQAHGGRIAWIAGLSLLIALAPALAAWLAKEMIDAVVAAASEPASAQLRSAALGFAAAEAAVLGALVMLRRVLGYYKTVLHAELGYTVGQTIFSKTAALDLETLERAEVQQQITLARQSAAARPFSLVNRVIDAGQFIVTLISFIALLATFSPWLVAILAVGGAPLFLGELRFSEAAFRFYTGRTPDMRARSYLEGLLVSAGAGPERIHSGATQALRDRHGALFSQLFTEDRRRMGRRAFLGAALIALSTAIFISGKLWVVWAAVLATISLGQMTLFIALLKQGQNTATNLLASFSGAYEDLLYASNLYALLDREEALRSGSLTRGPQPGDGYRLEAVTFVYPGADRRTLDDLNLHIPAGQHLGVVGANGSGKSTLIKLLIGLYRPTSGRILLDGAPLQDWDRDALFKRSAALFQPFQRYAFTARDNITSGLGLEPVEDGVVERAAERGLADAVIQALPDGLDTQLSRQQLDGHELSGGQWQRLAIARAMVRSGADVLLLDEPTSALDPDAEAALIEEVARSGATLVLVSHRLSNLRAVERIIVLDGGRIVEEGTHDSLLQAQGRYADLFAKQAGFYRK